MSTLDSLFQRMGRCYRKREYNFEKANVNIYTEDVSGVKYIYDNEIFNKSIELLIKFNNQILKEADKVSMVDILYSYESLSNTKFYSIYKDTINRLENAVADNEIKKSEAEKILNDINTIKVIPQEIYEKNIKIFEEFRKSNNSDRYKIKNSIDKLIINISHGKKNKYRDYIQLISPFDDIFMVSKKYSSEKGLLFEEDISNIN